MFLFLVHSINVIPESFIVLNFCFCNETLFVAKSRESGNSITEGIRSTVLSVASVVYSLGDRRVVTALNERITEMMLDVTQVRGCSYHVAVNAVDPDRSRVRLIVAATVFLSLSCSGANDIAPDEFSSRTSAPSLNIISRVNRRRHLDGR